MSGKTPQGRIFKLKLGGRTELHLSVFDWRNRVPGICQCFLTEVGADTMMWKMIKPIQGFQFCILTLGMKSAVGKEGKERRLWSGESEDTLGWVRADWDLHQFLTASNPPTSMIQVPLRKSWNPCHGAKDVPSIGFGRATRGYGDFWRSHMPCRCFLWTRWASWEEKTCANYHTCTYFPCIHWVWKWKKKKCIFVAPFLHFKSPAKYLLSLLLICNPTGKNSRNVITSQLRWCNKIQPKILHKSGKE